MIAEGTQSRPPSIFFCIFCIFFAYYRMLGGPISEIWCNTSVPRYAESHAPERPTWKAMPTGGRHHKKKGYSFGSGSARSLPFRSACTCSPHMHARRLRSVMDLALRSSICSHALMCLFRARLVPGQAGMIPSRPLLPSDVTDVCAATEAIYYQENGVNGEASSAFQNESQRYTIVAMLLKLFFTVEVVVLNTEHRHRIAVHSG